MRFFVALLMVFGCAISAQAQEDARPKMEAGKYTFAASWPEGEDMAQVCFFREDNNVQLGCVTTPTLQSPIDADSAAAIAPDGRTYAVRPPSPTGEVAILQDVEITNQGVDVIVLAFAEDTSGNQSISTNAAVVDFTPPAPPQILNVGE